MEEKETRFVTDADDLAIIQRWRELNGITPQQLPQSA